MVFEITAREESLPEIQEKGGLDYLVRLEEIRDFINHVDTPGDINIKKLKLVFDLIDDELLREYDKGLKWLEKIDLESSCLNGLNNRRSEMEILALMLKVMIDGANKTKILYQANLSYRQLKGYLSFLKKAGFVKERGDKKKGGLFITTSRGNLFLYHWSKIIDLLGNANKE